MTNRVTSRRAAEVIAGLPHRILAQVKIDHLNEIIFDNLGIADTGGLCHDRT
jgi:hypothetical protein